MNLWNNPVGVISQLLNGWIVGFGAPLWLASLLIQLIGVVVLEAL